MSYDRLVIRRNSDGSVQKAEGFSITDPVLVENGFRPDKWSLDLSKLEDQKRFVSLLRVVRLAR